MVRELTIFKAEIAAKYGAPVYSRQPPITAIFPTVENIKDWIFLKKKNKNT